MAPSIQEKDIPKAVRVLIINGSIRGTSGNSAAIAIKAVKTIQTMENAKADILTLSGQLPNIATVATNLIGYDAFLVVTGNYWNSWGSPLQRFIEVMTVFENTPVFFGKPVACVGTMDSVGGMELAARLHAVFSGLGCWSPPCSTLVLSRVGMEAIKATAGVLADPNEDVWRLDDLEIVLMNLVRASHIQVDWAKWPVKQLMLPDGPWPATGEINIGGPTFLEQ